MTTPASYQALSAEVGGVKVDPWQFTGPESEIVFEDGQPGIPGSGVVAPE